MCKDFFHRAEVSREVMASEDRAYSRENKKTEPERVGPGPYVL